MSNPPAGTLLATLTLLAASCAWGQAPGAAADAAAMSARDSAPVDMTGYFVSIITQDWLYRMVVPQRGQYAGIPITLRARQFADAWNRSADEAAGKQCEAYGAAAIMRIPTHLHISWQDDETLKVQTDAGMQVRLLLFKPTAGQMRAPPSWQGISVAQWMPYLEGPGFVGAAPRRGVRAHAGWLQVSTTDMLAGLLRKNGVPYSAQTHMSENWVLNGEQQQAQWLTVTTTLNDPEYLQVPYVLNSIFQRQADAAQWDPAPCSLSH
ncbi:MAG TPA: hypothetical protein VMF64_03820 [Steroidobacteraceae bacterium]|nr:hypothetical protein [Steroidobacteraceae bacterium]